MDCDCTLSNFLAFTVGYVGALITFIGTLALVKMGGKDEAN